MVSEYVVCLLDVLGQRDRLVRWDGLPEVAEGSPTVNTDVVRDTVEAVQGFRALFRTMFDFFRERTAPHALATFPEEQRERRRRFKECSVMDERFSDTFLFYSPLPNIHEDMSPEGVQAILLACCRAMLTSLAAKAPLRGAVTIGTGAVLPDGGFYGPALAEAYRLESEVADYPRVVVSPSVSRFLDANRRYSRNPDMARLMAIVAQDCRAFLWEDVDGLNAVDFLGKGHRDLIKEPKPTTALIRHAYTYVCSKAEEYKKAQNAKLARRYFRLREYMDSRLGLWTFPSASDRASGDTAPNLGR